MAGLIELNGRQVLIKFAADREDNSTDGLLAMSSTFGSSVQSSTPSRPFLNRQTSSASTTASAPRKLFVYNLSPNTTSESLGVVYGEYGPMEECFVVSDNNGVSKRYAFVTFFTEDSAWRCLEEPSKLVDGQMTFTHLASEGPSTNATGKSRNHQRRSTTNQPPIDSNLSPLAELLNGIIGKSL
jgi:RNA recognition motif-containing protein